jgi:hypothetical protein
VLVAFPVPESARVTHQALVENLRALGFLRSWPMGETTIWKICRKGPT